MSGEAAKPALSPTACCSPSKRGQRAVFRDHLPEDLPELRLAAPRRGREEPQQHPEPVQQHEEQEGDAPVGVRDRDALERADGREPVGGPAAQPQAALLGRAIDPVLWDSLNHNDLMAFEEVAEGQSATYVDEKRSTAK